MSSISSLPKVITAGRTSEPISINPENLDQLKSFADQKSESSFSDSKILETELESEEDSEKELVAETIKSKVEKKNSTSHLKIIPETRELRDKIRYAARDYVAGLDRSRPLTKEDSREHTKKLLDQLNLPEGYTGFTLVSIANEFWREQIASIPFNRRLLLLPHCLKNAEGCPADYDEFGLDCRKCGACSVADFKVKAEKLGYKVLVSEGTPIVLKIIVSGHVDAIVGVACLNVLEKAFDKILLAGIPCIATPLLSSNCKSTSVDDDWVFDMIDLQTAPKAQETKSYVHLMRAVDQLFVASELERLAPRQRKNQLVASKTKPDSATLDPLTEHEEIAYDFLARGGKHSRPFITLASYDALTGGKGTISADQLKLSDSVKRTALAIETFHKASLVHDDIEDDDLYRYGQETLHRQWGVGTAINIGDYLIGLGYRLVSRDRKELGAECAADILDRLADSHMRLSEGQGAELRWREQANKKLSPLDALKIYALKTAPAFEAALYSGYRLAAANCVAEGQEALPNYEKMIADFSRNLGVAFQIINDLKDWNMDDHNKLLNGQDILSARPTLLLALACEGLSPADSEELMTILQDCVSDSESDSPAHSAETSLSGTHMNHHRERVNGEDILARVRILYQRANVFQKATQMVEKYRARAEAIADEVTQDPFRELLYYLVDTVLEMPVNFEEATPLMTLELGLSR